MSETQPPVDSATEVVAPSETVAPHPTGEAGDPQGSAPASEDTSAPGQDEPKGEEPDRQTRREARAFASQRRQINELQREIGRLQERIESRGPSAESPADQPQGDASEVQRLRQEMAQQKTELVARTFWSATAKEAKDKGIDGFEDAEKAIRTGEVPTNSAMSHYVTEMADNRAALVVWLADNHEEAERIAGLDPVSAGVALAKVDARLSAKPAPKTTKAPPPPPTVSGRSTPVVDLSKITNMDEYAKARGYT